MKNDRLLTFSILGFVTLMHVALFALLMFLNPLSLPPTIQDMEFVDLAGLGLPGGGGGGEPEAAPAPEPKQQQAQPEPPKPVEPPKPEKIKPNPVVKEAEKTKIKPVVTKTEKADIRIAKEEPKPEPKPESKPEPKPEPKPLPPAQTAPPPPKQPAYTAPGGTGTGEGKGTDPKAHGKPGSTGSGGGSGGGKGSGEGTGTGPGSGSGSGGGHGDGGGAGSSAGNAIVKAGGNLGVPAYPSQSIDDGEEGTVVMDLLVDPSGQVTEVKVTKSSGYSRLDRAAQKGARAGHYNTGGKWVRFKGARITFKLP